MFTLLSIDAGEFSGREVYSCGTTCWKMKIRELRPTKLQRKETLKANSKMSSTKDGLLAGNDLKNSGRQSLTQTNLNIFTRLPASPYSFIGLTMSAWQVIKKQRNGGRQG
ncbi:MULTISPECIES: hypothetical protein [unclassified Lelliottia]|uniref:hypothetical protein n=1 Tax=unclassified Lelliottia TaxID=2642424 RepID=UPI0011AEF73E|nr:MULTISPECIES: hypothetical protein [unclassified Lelliottia]